jgi:hypothetical protein
VTAAPGDPLSSTSGRFRLASALLLVALVVAVGVALSNLRAIADAPLVDIAVPTAALQADGELLRGELYDGLPPYELHWDGQPPAAVLVDAARGTVLAAAAFSDESFAQNRNAVRFTSGRVHFVLDARRWTAAGSSLILRCEAVRPRGRFVLAALTALGLAAALLVLFAVRRHGACPIVERRARLRRNAEAVVFLLIGAAVFATCYPGVPVRVTDVSDQANINSFAAALDHPERFTRDRLLSNPDHFSWYTPGYIGLIRGFRRVGFHYATGEAFIGAVLTLILLFGFRRLFVTVTGSPTFAFVAALGLGLMFDEKMPPAGEYWSILSVTPRMLFTALVPWTLLVAIRCAPSSRRWWIASGLAGLLFHVHPLSAPVLVGAILVAFVVASDEPLTARVRGAALASAAALVTMVPYIVVYVMRYRQTVDVDPAITARTLEIIRPIYSDLQPWRLLRDLLVYRVTSFRILLDAAALALLLARRPFDQASRFYVGLAAGFLLVTFGIPAVDGVAAGYLDRRPFQFEMARGVRFLDLFTVGALALVMRDWRAGRRVGRAFVIGVTACALLSLGPGWFHTFWSMAGRGRLSWRILHGRPDAGSGAAMEVIRALQALRVGDARVSGPVGLREFDVPIAWVWKDVIALSYSSSRGLLESAETTARAQPLLATTVTEHSLAELSSILDAQIFLLRRRQVDAPLARSPRVLFVNDVYAIVHAPDPATARAVYP